MAYQPNATQGTMLLCTAFKISLNLKSSLALVLLKACKNSKRICTVGAHFLTNLSPVSLDLTGSMALTHLSPFVVVVIFKNSFGYTCTTKIVCSVI